MNSLEVLGEIAHRNRSRVSKCKVYDANVCTSVADPTQRWRSIAVEGQPFFKKASYTKDQHKIRLHANDRFLAIQVFFDSGLERLSVGRPNQVHFLKPAGELSLARRKYHLFAEDRNLSARQGSLLQNPNFRQLIQSIDPTPEEGIHFSGGDLKVYLWQPSTERTLAIIEAALSFVKTLLPQLTEIDFPELPEQFKSLIPLIQSWGIE